MKLDRYLTIPEAKAALALHASNGVAGQCSVVRAAVLVFVRTPTGTGQFPRKDWEESEKT